MRVTRDGREGARGKIGPGKKLSRRDDLRIDVDGKHGRVGRARQALKNAISSYAMDWLGDGSGSGKFGSKSLC